MWKPPGILIAVSEFDDIIHHFIQGFLHWSLHNYEQAITVHYSKYKGTPINILLVWNTRSLYLNHNILSYWFVFWCIWTLSVYHYCTTGTASHCSTIGQGLSNLCACVCVCVHMHALIASARFQEALLPMNMKGKGTTSAPHLVSSSSWMTCRQQLRNDWSLPAQFILHTLYCLEPVVPHHLTKISVTILQTLLNSHLRSSYGVGITIEPINKVHFQTRIQIKDFKFANIPQSEGPNRNCTQ